MLAFLPIFAGEFIENSLQYLKKYPLTHEDLQISLFLSFDYAEIHLQPFHIINYLAF